MSSHNSNNYQVLSYYEILEINKNATLEEIKKAYRNLVLKWHPDKWVNGNLEEKKQAEEMTKQINAAYETLSDPERRKEFDSFISNKRSGKSGIPFKILFGIGAVTLLVYLIFSDENERK